jgi:hypothetical protein
MRVIRQQMLAPKANATKVAETLCTQPEFLDAIQQVINLRNEPGYDPSKPDSDPAQGVIVALLQALREVPGEEVA